MVCCKQILKLEVRKYLKGLPYKHHIAKYFIVYFTLENSSLLHPPPN
jgi:hypothetical protein